MIAPRISILIPVYNRINFISDCINSALNQTFVDLEVIVVDNASNDGTWEICKQFVVQDKRVRVFRNESNIGPVRNWIRCVKEARGEYSKILFSDDLLEPNCIEIMISSFQNSDIGFAFCAVNIGISKEQSYLNYNSGVDRTIDSENYINMVIDGHAPKSPGAVLIRTKDLLKNLHTDFPTTLKREYDVNGAGPDLMIMLLTSGNYPKIAFIKYPLVFFRSHTGSITIENKDCKVTSGYESVISWYLINNYKKFTWIRYVTRIWLREIKNKNFISPNTLIRQYEGDGRLGDLFYMILFIPLVTVNRLVQEVKNRYDIYRN